jgi:hypothetical protein
MRGYEKNPSVGVMNMSDETKTDLGGASGYCGNKSKYIDQDLFASGESGGRGVKKRDEMERERGKDRPEQAREGNWLEIIHGRFRILHFNGGRIAG